MEDLLQTILAEKWILAAVMSWLWWLERQERKDAVLQWREEREQITQRISKLAEALRELKK